MKTPTYSKHVWLRIVLKVICVLILLNALFILIRPFEWLHSLSIYGSLIPYRQRLVDPTLDDQAVFTRIEDMLRTHEIARPKAANEFRIVLLGDSGILGHNQTVDETISDKITAAKQTVDGKVIIAYNLAISTPHLTRDLLIADAAQIYQPDLIVWFMSPNGFSEDAGSQDPLLDYNQERFTTLVAKYGLSGKDADTDGHYVDTWWSHSLLFQRSDILRWVRLQTLPFRIGAYNPSPQLAINDRLPDKPIEPATFQRTIVSSPLWKVLLAIPHFSMPVLLINEPILDVSPTYLGAQINRNIEYSRQVYAEYQAQFNHICTLNRLDCIDMSDMLPPQEFSDYILHHTELGNAHIAQRVIEAIQQQQSF